MWQVCLLVKYKIKGKSLCVCVCVCARAREYAAPVEEIDTDKWYIYNALADTMSLNRLGQLFRISMDFKPILNRI